MQIANPIYDVVFKYLMEDSKIAKLMLSSIIGENIEKLTFLPQEFISDLDNSQNQKNKKRIENLNKKKILTVYRLDFSAKIKTADGYKQVIIELQKAKFPTDIMRFRRYLGEQFIKKENTQKIKIKNKLRKTGLPIISIYFLGHKLDFTKSGAIKINRQYRDLITDEIIETKESFIESLTLDSYVIQIPYLTQNRRNDLEILLSVFDQSKKIRNEHHILNINEKDFPEKYRSIIRKLQKAVENTEIRKNMEMEDGIIDELEDMEREIEELELKVDEIERRNEQVNQKLTLSEQEKSIVEQEKIKAEHEKLIAEQENQKLKTELDELRKLLNNKE